MFCESWGDAGDSCVCSSKWTLCKQGTYGLDVWCIEQRAWFSRFEEDTSLSASVGHKLCKARVGWQGQLH
jgi:hypothetical protein